MIRANTRNGRRIIKQVSIESPINIVESMHTCAVDCDDEDFYIHEDVLLLYGER